MEAPHKFIANALSEGMVIPFLGAGASIIRRQQGGTGLPDGRGLANHLMDRFADYPDKKETSLTKIAQYCEECVAGRTPLYKVLRETFYQENATDITSPTAEMLASISAPLLIVTTNYDKYVENALAAAKRPFCVIAHITNREHSKWGFLLVQKSDDPDNTLIVDPTDFSINDYRDRTLIYKIHGTFGPENTFNPKVDTIVITENDYIDFMVMTEMRQFPHALAREFQQKHFLYLGYSLEDWNFRVILRKIQLTAELGEDFKSWAVQLNPSDTERQFWAKRDVDVYAMDLSLFTQRISDHLPRVSHA